MGGCSADYCTNSSRKGFQMCNIPTQEKRRKIWLQNISRQDWVAGNRSQLCHAHFTDDMWKITSEGKRRLKTNAVPTIFHNRIITMSPDPEQLNVDGIKKQNEQCKENSDPQITLGAGSEREVDSLSGVIIKEEIEDDESTDTNFSLVDESEAMVDSTIHHSEEESQPDVYSQESNQEEKPPTMQEYIYLKNRFNKLEKIFNATYKSAIRFKKELLKARHRIKLMGNKIEQLKHHEGNNLQRAIRKIWNEDQIHLLTQTYKKVPRWCNETLRNAHKLRFACGTAGYEEILRQNLPYPSIKTLTKKVNFYSDHDHCYSRNIGVNGISKNTKPAPQKRKLVSLLPEDAEMSENVENPD